MGASVYLWGKKLWAHCSKCGKMDAFSPRKKVCPWGSLAHAKKNCRGKGALWVGVGPIGTAHRWNRSLKKFLHGGGDKKRREP